MAQVEEDSALRGRTKLPTYPPFHPAPPDLLKLSESLVSKWEDQVF